MIAHFVGLETAIIF